MKSKQEQDLIKKVKELRNNFTSMSNRMKSKFSFRQIHTFRDLLAEAGLTDFSAYPQEKLAEKLSLDSIKLWLAEQQKKVEDDVSFFSSVSTTAQEIVTTPTIDATKAELLPPSKPEDYGLWPSSKEKAFLFWFQRKLLSSY